MKARLVSVGKTLCFHDLVDENPIAQISPHSGTINCVAFSPYIRTHNMHAYLIATAGSDGKIILTNASTYVHVLTLEDRKAKSCAVNTLEFSQNGLFIVSGHADGIVKGNSFLLKKSLGYKER